MANRRKIKLSKMILFIALFVILILTVSASVYMRQAQFGRYPSGKILDRIQASPNYRNGTFQNTSNTPTLTEGYSMTGELFKQLFEKNPRRVPTGKIPSVKTDLLHLSKDSDVIVWFGHSSYFMQVNGLKYLVDPVFSGNASPIPGTVRSYKGTDIYSVADFPAIDYLLITHDHYDHLDYGTVMTLKSKIKHVICGLGVGAHFEHWGFPSNRILEKDWYEKVEIERGCSVFTEPSRHQSGRSFSKNNTLWLSFVLQTPSITIYMGGDSGYGKHYKAIGDKYGPIDLAILENGQSNAAWRYIHMSPAEVLKAAQDLNAKRLFPVHSSKFTLARHSWDEPLIEISRLNKSRIPLVTPMIGEKVNLNDSVQIFSEWWKSVN